MGTRVWIPQHLIAGQLWWFVCNVSTREPETGIPGVNGPGRLVEWASSGFSEGPCLLASLNKAEHTTSTSGLHTCTHAYHTHHNPPTYHTHILHIHMYTHICRYTHTHTMHTCAQTYTHTMACESTHKCIHLTYTNCPPRVTSPKGPSSSPHQSNQGCQKALRIALSPSYAP